MEWKVVEGAAAQAMKPYTTDAKRLLLAALLEASGLEGEQPKPLPRDFSLSASKWKDLNIDDLELVHYLDIPEQPGYVFAPREGGVTKLKEELAEELKKLKAGAGPGGAPGGTLFTPPRNDVVVPEDGWVSAKLAPDDTKFFRSRRLVFDRAISDVLNHTHLAFPTLLS